MMAGRSVLVLDDEPTVMFVVAAMLRSGGYRIYEASQPAEAQALLGQIQGHIDLLLTDVLMPKMRGPQFAQSVLMEWPWIRIMYMSAFDKQDVEVYGVRSSDHYLSKPFTLETLLATVAAALQPDAV